MAQTAAGKDTETMFRDAKAFSTFSVKDVPKAKQFYGETLGLEVTDEEDGFGINFSGGGSLFLYPKEDHTAASFTVLNFPVDDIDEAVDELKNRGITFESYEGEMKTDEKGIFRGADKNSGPNIAWFKDPSGNILSVIETKS